MGLHRILVIDESAAIRETVAILLGGRYEVSSTTFTDLLSAIPEGTLDLIIAGAGQRSGEVIELFPRGVPVLWLAAGEDPTPEGSAVETLPRRFSPYELRRRVDDLLAAPSSARPAERARQRLEPPFLPATASRIVKQALAHDLPLCLFGEAGVGKRSVARSLHALRGGGPFLAVRGETFFRHPLSVEPARNATLFVDRVDGMGDDGQQRLLGILEPNGIKPLRLRVVAAAENDLGPLVEEGRFSRELYHRLTVLSALLPPLRERAAEVPALAQALGRELCQWLGVGAVQFSPSALQRLSSYLWFGNIAELEAVLARTLSLNRRPLIDAEDLLFESGSTVRLAVSDPPAAMISAAPAVAVAPSPQPRRQELAPEVLDLIINELAHEFKNPMATIKTSAQLLRRFLQDGANEEEVARLTGEAVDQMDQLLENLVQFTHFSTPVFQRVLLGDALGEAIAQVDSLPGTIPGRIECRALPPTAVRADRAQLVYALSNLLRTLLRSVPARQTMLVHHREPADVVVLLPPGSDPLRGQLAELLSPGTTGEPPLPLGIAIARALIERNGGSIAFEPAHEPTTITVRLSRAPGEEVNLGANGQSARSDH